MFALHETTRKRVCRTAFFALCVAPTLACAAWIAYAQRPWRDADEAQRLSAALQARTTLASFETPRPGIERAEHLSIADAATGRTLVTLDAWEVQRRGRMLAISAAAAKSELVDAHAIARKIAGWLAHGSTEAIEIRIDRLAVKLPAATGFAATAEFVLVHLLVRVDFDAAGGMQLRATARPTANGVELSPNGQLRFTATLAASGAHLSTIAIDSSEAATPTALLSPALEGAERLGDRCLFTGKVQIQIASNAISGVAKGRLDHADLAALLPAGSPHRLAGEAMVDLQRLGWRDRRLNNIAGSLRAENAQASRSLIAAAVEMLLCGQPSVEAAGIEGVKAVDQLVTLDAVACQFAWDESGLTITGANPSAENGGGGELAVGGGRVILFGPRYNQLSVGHWLRFVGRPATDWLPASRATIDIAARLPLPD